MQLPLSFSPSLSRVRAHTQIIAFLHKSSVLIKLFNGLLAVRWVVCLETIPTLLSEISLMAACSVWPSEWEGLSKIGPYAADDCHSSELADERCSRH